MANEVSPEKKTRGVQRSEAMPGGGTMAIGLALTAYLKRKGLYGKYQFNRFYGKKADVER